MTGKKNIVMSLTVNDMIVYIENPEESTKIRTNR